VGTEKNFGGSAWGKHLGVYLGTSLASLKHCAHSYVDSYSSVPAITMAVTGGTVYQIGVGSDLEDEHGPIVLSFDLATDTDINTLNIDSQASVANDFFANRVTIAGEYVSVIGYGAFGTTESLEPTADSGYGTVWWTYTAPAAGTVYLGTAGSSTSNSKYLTVWTGGNLPSLVKVIRSSSVTTPTVNFSAVAGQTYQISVGATNSSNTPGTVVLTLAGPAGGTVTPIQSLDLQTAVRLRWQSELNVNYRLQVSTTLSGWTNFGPAIIGDGSVMDTYYPTDPPNRYFKLVSF
jgi:hypothetical protein